MEGLKESGGAASPWLEVFVQRQGQVSSAAGADGLHINFQPPEKVDAVFTNGEHKVSSGVYVAKGDAKVIAEGSAVVYAFDQASVQGSGKATVFVSDKANAQMNGEGVVYARQDSTAYGFDKALVYAFDNVEVHAHDQPLVIGFDHAQIYSNDSSTTCAFNNAFVWPRMPVSPDMNRVIAFDNAVVATDGRQVNGKNGPLPRITLFNNATWIESEPQFHNPILHRQGNTP
jgi:hypothetical protein